MLVGTQGSPAPLRAPRLATGLHVRSIVRHPVDLGVRGAGGRWSTVVWPLIVVGGRRLRRRVSCAVVETSAPVLQRGDTLEESLLLQQLPRVAGEEWGRAPRCTLLGASDRVLDAASCLEILSWERSGQEEHFEVREPSSRRRGKICRKVGRTADEWVLLLEGAKESRVRLDNGSIEDLLPWAAGIVPSQAEVAAGLQLESADVPSFGDGREGAFLQGDGVVCFEAATFLSRLRGTSVRVPVVLPHGAIRLKLRPFLKLMSAAQQAIAESGSVNQVPTRTASGEALRPLVLSGRCRMITGRAASLSAAASKREDITYLTEAPLKSSAWFVGEDAKDAPELWEALEGSDAWSSSHHLPLLWTEEDSKVFVGDPGTGTRLHRDILWLPQLALVLAGEKLLAVCPWAAEDSEADASVASAKAGDLVAFNASGKHEAANVGDSPTAAVYQGFLPLAAVERFCQAPAEPPGSKLQYDGTLQVLRPERERDGPPLLDRLADVRQRLASAALAHKDADLLDHCERELTAAEERLAPKPELPPDAPTATAQLPGAPPQSGPPPGAPPIGAPPAKATPKWTRKFGT